MIIEGDVKISIISCDVLALQRDVLDEVCLEIEDELGIPFENILVAATYTHRAPTTVTIHGYERDDAFCKRVKDIILLSMHIAEERLKNAEKAEMYFSLEEESTVGQNSHLWKRRKEKKSISEMIAVLVFSHSKRSRF